MSFIIRKRFGQIYLYLQSLHPSDGTIWRPSIRDALRFSAVDAGIVLCRITDAEALKHGEPVNATIPAQESVAPKARHSHAMGSLDTPEHHRAKMLDRSYL